MRKILNAELGRKSAGEFKQARKTNVIIILDNVRSAMNVGSVFRTSDAFAVQSVYLCGITAQPPNREIQKTALGATDSVDWKYFSSTGDAIQQLKQQGIIIAGIEQLEGGINLEEFQPIKDKTYAFVFGNEINGLSDDILNLIDVGIEIPQFGTKHSFNISVTAGIVLWDYFSKWSK